MEKPPPDNLGSRQRELNRKINDACSKQLNFDEVIKETDFCEVDKFFKIDLAAKSRNIDYIIDVFKAGETLYAHRALKRCPWIYDDEYSHIINPDYLQDNIFPVTSMRVQLLILKSVAMQVRNAERAEAFYHYCMKIKMTDIALKCVLFTSDEFKLNLLKNKTKDILRKKFSYIRFIIGNSFELLEAYMNMLTDKHEETILKFRYLYPVNNIKYIELIEKYVRVKDYYDFQHYYYDKPKFDNKLCDDIMKKYKARFLAKPIFYLNNINRDVIVRNITVDEAKIIIKAILPSTAQEFWASWFHYYCGKAFIDLLPHSEKLAFIKKIFNDKYPDEGFETRWDFYNQHYYKFMTAEQREEWALKQIESDKQVLGVGKDYMWYEFINFKDAFEEIVKKYVYVTKEPEIRAGMLVTLIKSRRENRDLEKLFQYYLKRHSNEPIPQKIYFMDQVISHQNVYEFDDPCWEAFYALLLSLEMYTSCAYPVYDPRHSYSLENYKNVTLYYHILYHKVMPEELMDYFLNVFYPQCEEQYGDTAIKHHLEKLTDEKRQFLFDFLHTFYTNKINEYKYEPYTYIGRQRANRYSQVIVQLIRIFNVNLPIYKKEPVPQKQRKTRNINTILSDRQLLRELKKDKTLVVEKLGDVKTRLKHNNPVVINNFLKKIKIYFKNDITESYLKMFEELVLEKLDTKSVDACVNAIFVLGDESAKVDLMQKYVPENVKIDFHNLDSQKLCTQRMICKYAACSLPPVPLDNMLMYMKGDYVHHCLHIFSIYSVALPMSVCTNLVESVLSSPVSIQKHALRLAYQCFSAESLKNVSKNIWENTKNVSLRFVIYKALFNRIVDKNEHELYDILISFTLDLHDDDEKPLFGLVESSTLPHEFLGDYKKATWTSIRKFKDREPNIGRKVKIIDGIRWHLHLMDMTFVREIIDEHLDLMFEKNKQELNYSKEDIAALYKEKWTLTRDYIFEETEVELAQDIIKKCLGKWNEQRSGIYVYQTCCWDFIEHLNTVSLEYVTISERLWLIYQVILDQIQEDVPLNEIYMKKWEMELIISNRKVMEKHRENFDKNDKLEVIIESSADFGKGVGKLVSEYVDKNIYFTSVSESIKTMVLKRLEELLTIIFSSTVDSFEKYRNDAMTCLGFGLVEYNIAETGLLALGVLPSKITDTNECLREKYQCVIETALKSPYPEVQYAAYQKTLN